MLLSCLLLLLLFLSAFSLALLCSALVGLIDPSELEVVARCFNLQANTEQEVKVIFGKLDKNQDGHIDLREWVSVLFDLFRFMSAGAFDKHCEELLALLKKAQAEHGGALTASGGGTAHATTTI